MKLSIDFDGNKVNFDVNIFEEEIIISKGQSNLRIAFEKEKAEFTHHPGVMISHSFQKNESWYYPLCSGIKGSAFITNNAYKSRPITCPECIAINHQITEHNSYRSDR